MLKGKCLCGAVRIEVEGELEHAPEACHCSQCRKQSGHVLSTVNVRRSALTIHGEDAITWYRSSDQVQRAFCSICGSTLFWHPTIEGYAFTAVAMGLFGSPTGTKLAKHTFVGDKGDYYDINDGVPQSNDY
ncbi:GFA family protein [Bauldia sp.]|uniref:GFA family protein n=1 Tax=Bauldia sp. TaxID=2575872 RepID=UPI003BA9C5B5